MAAKLMIDHHMMDCNIFRENLRNDMIEFRQDIKKLYWRVALILGGLILASHGMDWLIAMGTHK